MPVAPFSFPEFRRPTSCHPLLIGEDADLSSPFAFANGEVSQNPCYLRPMSNVFDREARSRARGAVPGHRRPSTGARQVSAESGTLGAGAVGAGAVGTLGLGSLAIGAMAIGALAIGALAIGRLSVKRGRFERLHIGELTVDRLRLGRIEPLDHY